MYSLGIIGYQMLLLDLTAEPGADFAHKLARRNVPQAVADLLGRCLSSDAEDRPADAGELADELRTRNRQTRRLTLAGQWRSQDGEIFHLHAHLNVLQSLVEGYIAWKLVEAPPGSPSVGRVGGAGCEFVSGSLEGNQLTLDGCRVDDSKLLGEGTYTLKVDEERGTFEGTSQAKTEGPPGSLRGRLIVHPEVSPIRGLRLTGQWTAGSQVFDLRAQLPVDQCCIRGYIEWKRIGKSGCEFVSGFLERDQLTLHGYRVDAPDLLAPDNYTIKLDEKNARFKGTSRVQQDGQPGSLSGHLEVLR